MSVENIADLFHFIRTTIFALGFFLGLFLVYLFAFVKSCWK